MKLLLTIFFSVVSLSLFSQKKYKADFSFPGTLNLAKLRIQVDNGFGRMSIPFQTTKNNRIILSGIYYSKYAAIVISYPQTESWDYRNIFFLDERPAKIKFFPSATDSSPFDHYVITDAYDFKVDRNKMEAFSAAEIAEGKRYYAKYGNLIFDGRHKELEERFTELDHNIYKKDIQYVEKTGESYYSFWYFRSNSRYSGLPVDSILSIFENTFPDRLKNSTEGNAFRQLLTGKLKTKKGNPAAQFTSRDIIKNTVSLSSFRSKKFVLLDFWATWCIPCLKKMPLLRELREKFHEDLEIISVAYPTSLSDVKSEIENQKMNWINIYNDTKLINSYGGMGAIPRLFLINKSGNIIYDNQEDNDGDLKILVNILQKCLAAK